MMRTRFILFSFFFMRRFVMMSIVSSLFLLGFSGCNTTPEELSESESENMSEAEENVPAETSEYSEPKTDVVFLEDVQYMPENQNVTGYLVRPNLQGPLPAVILIHEWWGLNDNIKELAEQFAEQGYVALAVDLYEGEVAEEPEEAQVLAGSVREDTEGAFANLNAAVTYLQGLEYVEDERMASVGWCFGGQWSYEMAKNDLGTAASVMYYGRFSPADDLSHMKALIQGHFGEEDMSIAADDVREFQAKLQTLSGEHEVYIYPNAGHAFANSDSDSYDEAAAQLAWERTLDFLQKSLPDAAMQDPEDDFTWGEGMNPHGTVAVRGYAVEETVSEPFCEENCTEYQYVSFQMLQTTSQDFKDFLENNAGNLATEYSIGLGCLEDGVIRYSNDSDEYGMKEFQLSPELTAEIMAATEENPIALQLTKEELSGGRGAPACYSHFTTIERL